jgi:hypothetical protein
VLSPCCRKGTPFRVTSFPIEMRSHGLRPKLCVLGSRVNARGGIARSGMNARCVRVSGLDWEGGGQVRRTEPRLGGVVLWSNCVDVARGWGCCESRVVDASVCTWLSVRIARVCICRDALQCSPQLFA